MALITSDLLNALPEHGPNHLRLCALQALGGVVKDQVTKNGSFLLATEAEFKAGGSKVAVSS